MCVSDFPTAQPFLSPTFGPTAQPSHPPTLVPIASTHTVNSVGVTGGKLSELGCYWD